MDPALADIVGGSLGGCARIVVGHPLDTVKVRLQTQNPAAPLYRGTIHCLSTIIKNESFRGLYKGMSSPLYGSAFTSAIVWSVYGNSMRSLEGNSLANNFIAGAVAGAAQSIVNCPMELVKTKMQLQGVVGPLPQDAMRAGLKPALYRSSFDCLFKLYNDQGIRSVYRGFTVTIAREMPGFGLFFLTYEYLTRVMAPPGGLDRNGHPVKGQLGVGRLLLAGGLSGIISWMVSFPQDMVKSRYQADAKYASAWQCAVLSYRSEGITVFAKGLWPTVLRAFPTSAASLTVVMLFLRYIGHLNDEKYLQDMVL